MKSAPNKESDMDTAYEILLQQIRDAQQLQYNAVMMCDRSGTVSRLDAILDELYAKKARMNAGR